MKVLVTGATGYVGRAVSEFLISQGHTVRALLRESSHSRYLEGMDLEKWYGDITDRGSVARAARGVDAVVNAAGVVRFDRDTDEDLRRVNVRGVEQVASSALEVGARRLVHVSSIFAISGSSVAVPATETFSPPASSIPIPYVASKLQAEEIAFQYARMGMDVVVVNPCVVVGAPDPRGSDPGHILRFLRRQIPMRLRGGANFVDLHDVAFGINAALEKGRSGERYIIGGENLLFREFYELLEDVSGVRAPRFPISKRLARSIATTLQTLHRTVRTPNLISPQLVELAGGFWFADSTKARTELGVPLTPLRTSLAKAVQYYRIHDMV